MRGKDAGGMRLNQFLARSGAASRRGAEGLILAGRVTVNGSIVTDLAVSVDPERDSVKLDGHRLRPSERALYFALYKPREVVSTLSDPEGRPCLKGFLPKGAPALFPAGRLDFHSEGLILLTSDGELGERLLHPRYKVVKTYYVKVKGSPPREALDRLKRGIVVEGHRTLPVEIRSIPSRETRHTWLQVEMREGRKNQLREMFFRIQHPVIKLKRVGMGPVRLGKLKPGECRPLAPEEVLLLKQETGLEAVPARRGPSKPPGKRANAGGRPC